MSDWVDITTRPSKAVATKSSFAVLLINSTFHSYNDGLFVSPLISSSLIAEEKFLSSKYKQETVSFSPFPKQGVEDDILSLNNPINCKHTNHESLQGLIRLLKGPLTATHYSNSTVKGDVFLQLLKWASEIFPPGTSLI